MEMPPYTNTPPPSNLTLSCTNRIIPIAARPSQMKIRLLSDEQKNGTRRRNICSIHFSSNSHAHSCGRDDA
ncbi:hypothetical protein TNCV_95941 [Trichonephila clavipes]|nr:hypothetical protein TNCV_95941 [Trichonephila clavipes]